MGSGVNTGGGGGRAGAGAWVGSAAAGAAGRARAKPRPLENGLVNEDTVCSTSMMGVGLAQLARSGKQLVASSAPYKQLVQKKTVS